MNQGYKVIIEIIRNYINNEITEPTEADWDKLYLLSQKHQITAIIYYQCKSFCPDERFRTDFLNTVSRYTNMTHEYKRIATELSEKSLVFFCVKGPVVAQYYQIPQVRSMGDIDMIIPEREKADSIIKNLGYSIVSKPEDHDWIYFKKDYEVELHNKLVYDQPINTPEIEAFYNAYQLYVHNNELECSFHFMYLILHLRKHFMNEGVGIRQFIDIALMIRNCHLLNWSWIEEKLTALNLRAFSENVFALIYRWFAVLVPLSKNSITDSFFEDATAKILGDGVFGYDNKNNGKNSVINSIGIYRCGFGVLEVLKRIFPPYTDMCSTEQYSFVKGKRILLPIAWLYRLIYCVSHGKSERGKIIIRDSMISDQDYFTRKKELERWGLTI